MFELVLSVVGCGVCDVVIYGFVFDIVFGFEVMDGV